MELRTFIKLEPFIYNVLYIIILTILLTMDVPKTVKYLFNISCLFSPLLLIISLIRSKLARMCKYHRLAVAVPFLGFITVVAKKIFKFTDTGDRIAITLVIAITLLTIFAGVKIILKNKKRRNERFNKTRNA